MSPTTKKTFIFVTGSNKKRQEFERIVEQRESLHNNIIVHNYKFDLPEIQGSSLEEITEAKVISARDEYINVDQKNDGTSNLPCKFEDVSGIIVEDTALCFNALGGLPGAYIKWFVDSVGIDDLPKVLVGFEDKTADAVCTFGLWIPTKDKGETHIFQGRCNGSIVPPRGGITFGWDAIFEPLEKEQIIAAKSINEEFKTLLTYGEMNPDAKNSISHRGKSLAKLLDFIETLI